MVKDHSAREETRFSHMGYSFRLAARVLLYAPSHRQDSTYHGLCYTSRGALLEREIAQWGLKRGVNNNNNNIAFFFFLYIYIMFLYYSGF